MFHRFKNLDKKQKLELYKVLGYSICALIGGAGSAKQIGVGRFGRYNIGLDYKSCNNLCSF